MVMKNHYHKSFGFEFGHQLNLFRFKVQLVSFSTNLLLRKQIL